MTQDQFQEILFLLMQKGLHIDMYKRDGVLWFDLNADMKSHLYVKYNAEKQCMDYEARYSVTGAIADIEGLISVARDCMRGRDYANSVWLDIFKEHP